MTIFIGQEKSSLDDLAHHGVKGMHWGVRKDNASGNTPSPRFTPQQKEAAKKVAIGVGVLAAVAGATYLGIKLKENGSLPVSSIDKAASTLKGADLAKSLAKEPTDVVYASRGKNVGFTFLKKGGLDDALTTYEDAFGSDSGQVNVFKFMPNGSIAASFHDPGGAKDFAGRVIPHEILIPKSMTEGIHNLEDVKNKIYTPHLKAVFEANYLRETHGHT